MNTKARSSEFALRVRQFAQVGEPAQRNCLRVRS